MRNLKNSYDLNDQKEESVKKSQKHDVNLQKNTTIYFQIGLIVCLLFSYGLLEMEFASKTYTTAVAWVDDLPVDYVPDTFKVYEEPVKEVKETPKKEEPKFVDKVKVVDDDDTIAKETAGIITEPEITNVVPSEPDFRGLEKVPEEVTLPYAKVEVTPVFPGCEKATTNAERKACMSKKIARHIQKKFDTDIASELGLSGRQRINVAFKIDQNGDITEVTAITKHKELKLEAEDVIGKLPKMIPGKQHNKNVSVVYSQPIIFNVN
ncbi:energy transducer TonB [Lacinutrix sp. WUR7]|uniref:energy transducer TonB n=1 Tax=Lacinutrix sp. WUR7 TaxID=2653681 RepID=UPI00193CF3D4|nr:energy transducer TonB [Lacinutrix sp. WUR7]QRM89088.1 energy transducer TonB [Lacinutrix sp. WUR7]